jgi:hypothetical protein
MSLETSVMALKPRSKILIRAAEIAAVSLIALSAVTSADAQPHQTQPRAPAATIYPWDFGGPPAPPNRSYYPAPSSEIAPPMQEAAPIAPLSPHPAPDYSGF